MGLPTVGQVGGSATVSHCAFWPRAYNLIWNEWFRDENLQNAVARDMGNGPDNPADYVLLRRGKRHDYFTSALPWPQKGAAVTLSLGTTAPIFADAPSGASVGIIKRGGSLSTLAPGVPNVVVGSSTPDAQMFADLSQATAATINQIRQSFQIQKLLERDARGGTRYTEIIRAHFGVISPDARLQRPEYLGGYGTVPAANIPRVFGSISSASNNTGAYGNWVGYRDWETDRKSVV